MIEHPRKALLRAHADGEGTRAERGRLAMHLLRCARCRLLQQQYSAERTTVSAVLAGAEESPDLAAAWTRIQVRAGRSSVPRAGWSWRSAGVGALAAAVMWLVAGSVLRAPEAAMSSRVVGASSVTDSAEMPLPALRRVQQLVAGRETAFAPSSDEQPLVAAALLSLRRGAGAEVRNVCCGDHDAGGPRDDGLLTLSRPGEDVATVVIYEDRDASGDLSPGDLIRFVSQRGSEEEGAGRVLRS